MSYLSQAQIVENGCIKIDFETILEDVPTSGMSLGDQYFASTGIRFYLGDGNIPVIAGVGAPLEAFAGPTGPDSGPDDDILGNFMLTDDGLLGSADFAPLFISFENPVDSISGVILDLDGDEYFDIEALDINGNVAYSTRINAGDLNTGDGVATPFGFNLPSCEGTVSSISFSGFRNDGGGFGLAMDNFVFCFEGADLLEDLDVIVTNILCQDNPGVIEVINNGNLNLQFSIDGNNFSDSGYFGDLTTGDYLIIVQDENGCQAVINESVMADGPTVIEEIEVTHTSCGLDNGSFVVTATQESGVIYFIDAFELSNDNEFTDLEAGTYPITVIGPTGCSASSMVTINPSDTLFFDGLIGVDDACQKTVGEITVMTTGGTGDIMYSIDDGENFQTEAVFDSLTEGFYNVLIQDESFCSFSDTISLFETPGATIGPISTTPTICEVPSGVIQFVAEGGSGNLQYQINGGNFQDVSYFESLEAGEYEILVQDELGCIWEANAEIEIPICPIFIPNIFTPEDLNINNEFKIYSVNGQDITITRYEIYDRWGSRIYTASNFDILSEGSWWQGRSDGVKWSSGVYAYLIEVEYFNGEKEVFAGDITLVR